MIVFSSCLGRMLCTWMSPLMLEMFLVHGLSGLVMLRPHPADAFRFSGGPVHSRGLVLGRGGALFRVVPLGGLMVKRVRCNTADAVDGPGCVLVSGLIHSSLIGYEAQLQRCHGCSWCHDSVWCLSLVRSVELTDQWERILAAGPLYPVTWDDPSVVWGLGFGDFRQVVSDVHHRLSDFIHAVVLHRRDEAILGVAKFGLGRTLSCIPISGFGLIWFLLLPFFSVSLILRLVVLGFWLIRLGSRGIPKGLASLLLPLWAEGSQP